MSTTKSGEITEQELLKALADIEGQVKAVGGEEETGPKIEVVSLKKAMTETISELGSADMAMAMDASEVLNEVATLMGIHVDRSLGALEKSINAGLQRDHAILGALQALKKSIDDNTAAITALGSEPGKPASRQLSTQRADILPRGDGAAPATSTSPQELRKSITAGFSRLLAVARKSNDASEVHRLSGALIRFESAGQISDADMSAALAAGK